MSRLWYASVRCVGIYIFMIWGKNEDSPVLITRDGTCVNYTCKIRTLGREEWLEWLGWAGR